MPQVQELFFSDPEMCRMYEQWYRSLPSFAADFCLSCANPADDKVQGR
jgi:hypothetical protein